MADEKTLFGLPIFEIEDMDGFALVSTLDEGTPHARQHVVRYRNGEFTEMVRPLVHRVGK